MAGATSEILRIAPSGVYPNPWNFVASSTMVEAGWDESALITINLSLSQEPTIYAPNSILICHCPRINFRCTIFVNYMRVSTIFTTFSLKIIPQLILKISKSHVSIIPMANLWGFWVKFSGIWYKIDENGSNIFNDSFNFKILEQRIEWTSHGGTIF